MFGHCNDTHLSDGNESDAYIVRYSGQRVIVPKQVIGLYGEFISTEYRKNELMNGMHPLGYLNLRL